MAKKTLGQRIGMVSIPEIKKQYPRQFKQIQKLTECQALSRLFNKFEKDFKEEEQRDSDDNDFVAGEHSGWTESLNYVTSEIRAVMDKRKCK
jgi:hypothetical protein